VGASGDLGRKTVLHLLKRKPASDVVALVRDPAKAADLTSPGVELRRIDRALARSKGRLVT
jgi:NAD(P)H dehydrogenase (quinone)